MTRSPFLFEKTQRQNREKPTLDYMKVEKTPEQRAKDRNPDASLFVEKIGGNSYSVIDFRKRTRTIVYNRFDLAELMAESEPNEKNRVLDQGTIGRFDSWLISDAVSRYENAPLRTETIEERRIRAQKSAIQKKQARLEEPDGTMYAPKCSDQLRLQHTI